MILRTRGLYGRVRAPVGYTQWQRIQFPHRCFANATPDSGASFNSETTATNPDWFEKLRAEMLARELPQTEDRYSEEHLDKISATLLSCFPRSWQTSSRAMPAGIGEHTFFFNPVLPDHELLPDGTDQIHSPGGAFERRMWAGGSLVIEEDQYWRKDIGWGIRRAVSCSERITDVQLRGSGNNEKIFVTIERKVKQSVRPRSPTSSEYVRQSTHNPYLVEVRNIVFLRAHSFKVLEDIKQGNLTPVKYLRAPNSPDFSHTFTPTHTLLSRFSALTFNAHRIHLDREYARSIEGHRNILVHGPLTLTLILKFVGTHMSRLPDGQYYVQNIEYRNLAPLYCDEQLRLCAKEKMKTRTDESKEYDVWIEGPTGGMAFKGVVRLSRVPVAEPESRPTPPRVSQTCEIKTNTTPRLAFIRYHHSDSTLGRRFYSQSSRHQAQDESRRQTILTPFSVPEPQPAAPNEHAPSDSHDPSNDNSHRIRAVPTDLPTRLQPSMTLANRNLLRRTSRGSHMFVHKHSFRIDPIPVVRYRYRELAREILNSKFSRRGARFVAPNKATIRPFYIKESRVIDREVYDSGHRWIGGPRKIGTDRKWRMFPQGKSAARDGVAEEDEMASRDLPLRRSRWHRK